MSSNFTNKTKASQEKIYRDLYNEHKGSPMAVSSESLEHKKLRFSKIAGIFKEEAEKIEVHDVGMGLADFYGFLNDVYPEKKIAYSGTEILKEYVEASRLKYPACDFFHRDLAEKAGQDTYDYLIMSGVFHQRRDSTIPEWERFSQSILKNAFKMCKKGIAFNFITPFVDFYQEQVYYCNLPKLLNFVNDDLSRFFKVDHAYALYEFTVFVYKEEYIRSLHSQREFNKYFKV